MTRLSPIAAAFVAGLLLASTSHLAFAASPPVAAQTTIGTAVWAQDHSDLPPDPAVRFGVLPNGMRYAVMRNATPAGQTALRLRIGSGSLEESDAEQGLAHVLEHMAFRGSKNVPADEMIKILERKGLAFGPDTNAETEWTQTVYMLDLPRSDADTLGTGLMLMRETAGNLNLDAAKLDPERGVVLSEERLRDTPDYRAEKAQIDLFLHDQLAARRFPIGQVDVIKTAPASLLRAFYEANYRPERATFIAVGDFDPADMETRIKALFSDWKGVGPATAEPDLGRVERRGLVAKAVQLPGASTRATIGWVRPFDASADTAAKERRETIENLGLAVLNRRLARLAEREHPPFLSAGAGFENLFRSGKIAVVEATSPPVQWRDSLAAAENEVRRLVAYGASQAELDREIAEARAGMKSALAGATTRPTPSLASGLVDAVDQDAVFTAPSTDLEVFESAVKDLTVDKVNAAIKAVFAGAGPLVEIAGPDAIAGGDAAVAEAFAKAAAAPLAAPKAEAAVAWPYGDFGKAGAIVQQASIPDLGLTTVHFANGVRLMIKPTDFRKDQVLVGVDVGQGRLELPMDRKVATWSVGALITGGFGKMTYEDAERALAGRLHSVSLSLGNDAFEFRGATRPADLDAQLQVMAAYLTDPGFRPEAFERARTGLLSELPQLEATPDGVFERDSGGLLTSGDPRFFFPDKASLEAARLADWKALLAVPLAHGRVDVTIVGDISVARAIELTAATFGALPQRPAAAPPAPPALRVKFPEPTSAPVLRYDTGRADQAVAVVAWPATGFFRDMAASRAAMLAGEVFGDRLLEKVRIAQGATYSPETRVDLSQVYPDYGVAFSQVEMPPPLIPGFFDTVTAIAKDLRDKGVTEDELARARNPRIANLRKAQLTNEYWLTDLDNAMSDPRKLDLIRTTFSDYERLTPADLQTAAKAWFRDETAWRMVVRARP